MHFDFIRITSNRILIFFFANTVKNRVCVRVCTHVCDSRQWWWWQYKYQQQEPKEEEKMKRKRNVQSIKNKNEKFQTTTTTAAPCSSNVEYAENWTNQYVYRILLGNVYTYKLIGQCMLRMCICLCTINRQKQTTAENKMTQQDKPQFLKTKKVWTEFYFNVSVSECHAMRLCVNMILKLHLICC